MTEPQIRAAADAPAGTAGRTQPIFRKLTPWLIAGGASVLVVTGLAFAKYSQIMAAIAYGQSFPEPAEAVLAVTAQQISEAPATTTTGELQAVDVVDLRLERSGVVVRVNFRSGDLVERGQTLVQIDTSEEAADLAAAKIEATRARRDADRLAGLFEQGAAAKVTAEQAGSSAAAAESRVAALETEIDRKAVRAPFSGRVGITDLKPGQYVSEGTLVTRLVGQRAGMYVDFTLPQEAVASIDLKRPVQINSGAFSAPARIIASEPSIDGATRSLRYRALMENYRGALPAGSLVTVSAETGQAQDVVVVPRTAVMRSPYGATVFRLADVDGQLRARAVLVEPGRLVGEDKIIIVSGLEPGARIAADGVFKLRDGGLVRALDPNEATRQDGSPRAGDTK